MNTDLLLSNRFVPTEVYNLNNDDKKKLYLQKKGKFRKYMESKINNKTSIKTKNFEKDFGINYDDLLETNKIDFNTTEKTNTAADVPVPKQQKTKTYKRVTSIAIDSQDRETTVTETLVINLQNAYSTTIGSNIIDISLRNNDKSFPIKEGQSIEITTSENIEDEIVAQKVDGTNYVQLYKLIQYKYLNDTEKLTHKILKVEKINPQLLLTDFQTNLTDTVSNNILNHSHNYDLVNSSNPIIISNKNIYKIKQKSLKPYIYNYIVNPDTFYKMSLSYKDLLQKYTNYYTYQDKLNNTVIKPVHNVYSIGTQVLANYYQMYNQGDSIITNINFHHKISIHGTSLGVGLQLVTTGTVPYTNIYRFLYLDPNDSNPTGHYVDMNIKITGGKGVGQERIITNYYNNGNNSTSHYAYISPNWDICPDDTSEYEILEQNLGLPVATGSVPLTNILTRIYLDSNDPNQSNYYNDMTIIITGGKGVGQIRTITDYNNNGSNSSNSHNTYISLKWDIHPDETTEYDIRKQSTENNNNTIKLDPNNKIQIDDYYKNMTINITSGIGYGQTRTIIAYDPNTNVATVNSIWVIDPIYTETEKTYYTIFNQYHKIIANQHNNGYWYIGKINKIHDNYYDILYDFGSMEINVPIERMKYIDISKLQHKKGDPIWTYKDEMGQINLHKLTRSYIYEEIDANNEYKIIFNNTEIISNIHKSEIYIAHDDYWYGATVSSADNFLYDITFTNNDIIFSNTPHKAIKKQINIPSAYDIGDIIWHYNTNDNIYRRGIIHNKSISQTTYDGGVTYVELITYTIKYNDGKYTTTILDPDLITETVMDNIKTVDDDYYCKGTIIGLGSSEQYYNIKYDFDENNNPNNYPDVVSNIPIKYFK